VKSSEQSVLSVVLEADVERTSLIQKEKTLLEQQQVVGDEPGALQSIMDQLTEVYERMSLIGANTAESRAASILSGTVFFVFFVSLCCVVLCCVVLCCIKLSCF
jgi:ATP-binding cassette, subfamily F, member 3